MTSGIYNRFKANLMSGAFNLNSDTIKVALLNNSHSFSGAHNVWSDISTNEITGTGYTSGGATLAGKTVVQASTSYFDANDTAWSSASFTAYYCVLYDTTASNNLICCIDLGGAQTVTSGTFTMQWNASGIITLA